MKTISARVRVLNSLLFIRDAQIKDLPEIDGNGAVWSTLSCVAVCCQPDCDGPTEIIIGNSSELRLGDKPLFDRRLQTPSRRLIVETVLAEKVCEQRVPDVTTRLRIWTNGQRAADKITVGLE